MGFVPTWPWSPCTGFAAHHLWDHAVFHELLRSDRSRDLHIPGAIYLGNILSVQSVGYTESGLGGFILFWMFFPC